MREPAALLAALAIPPWSAPHTLSSPHEFIDPVAIAFTRAGDGLASWTWQDGTDARALTGAGAAALPDGPERRIVAAKHVNRATTLVGVVPTAAHRFTRVTIERRTEGGAARPVTYAVAIRRAGGDRFGEQRLERQPASAQARPVRLAVEPNGRATVAWATLDAPGVPEAGARGFTTTRVRVSTCDPGTPFSGTQDVSPAGLDAAPGDLAAAAGRRIVTWEQAGAIEAAYAGVGASLFGAPELVTPGPNARIPRVAFDPRTRRPTIVWSARPEGGTKTVAQAAARG